MKRRQLPFIVGFLAPATLLYAGLVLFPLAQSFYLSLFRWRGVSARKRFVGLENFQKLAQDENYLQAVKNTLWLLVAGGLVILILAVALAGVMRQKDRGARALRAVILMPQAISLIVVAVVWRFVYNPQFGLLNASLNLVGLKGLTRAWLGDPKTALASVGAAFAWHAVGFYAMLFGAALQNVPTEIEEAAQLDGAVGLKQFWLITWPLLWPVRRVATVHLALGVINVFALVFQMTQGGPDRRTETLLTYLYEQAFKNSQFGYATAVAVANLGIAAIVAVAILLYYRKDPSGARA